MSCTLRKLDPLFVAGLVEEAHLNRIGNVRRDPKLVPSATGVAPSGK